MWLPEKVYEGLPYAYIAMGVMFILGSLYIGVESVTGPYYMGLGVISVLSGIIVFARRAAARKRSPGHAQTGTGDPS